MEEAAQAKKASRTWEEWQGLIEEYVRRGHTMSSFCRERGIVYKDFLYHRSKILKKSSDRLSETRCAGLVPSRGVGSLPVAMRRQGAFMPVHVVAESRGVRLKFARGLVLESDELPDATWLVEVALRWNDTEVSPC